MRGALVVVASLAVTVSTGAQTPVAQDPVHFPPTDRITVHVMTDVPPTSLGKGFNFRQIVGATGSFSFAELEAGAGSAGHHHTREQANVGIEGVMDMGIGDHREPLPVGAAVITPPNVRHGVRNSSSTRLLSLEFHTIQRPDLTPSRPRPAVPYPVAPEPVPVADGKKLVVQLSSADQPHGVAKTITGETCSLSWRRLAAGAASVDLGPARGSETFVYVVSGEADLISSTLKQRVKAGMLILIPAKEEHVSLKALGRTDVALVEFTPALR
jgi:mannose-6-phosphate isomerase-like protein (cupin superfamily)